MESKSGRDSKTVALDLERLEHESRKLLALGFLAAALFHVILGVLLALISPAALLPTTEMPYRIIHADIITVTPLQEEPFILREHGFQSRDIRSGRPEIPGAFSSGRTLPTVPKGLGADTLPDIPLPDLRQEMRVGDRGIKESPGDSGIPRDTGRLSGNSISLRDELISPEDLDDGRYTSLIIRDPSDTRNLKGFVHIPVSVWGTELHPDAGLVHGRALECLREAVTRFTGMKALLDKPVYLDAADFSHYPFLYITDSEAFSLTGREVVRMREYFENGGFALLEPYGSYIDSCHTTAGIFPLRQMIRDIFGDKNVLKPIPRDHELYSCYFDTDISEGSPVPIRDEMCPHKQARNSLEGIFLQGRLALVYSEKRYGERWNAQTKLEHGVNLLVYALLSGKISRQIVDSSVSPDRDYRKWWSLDSRERVQKMENRNPPHGMP